MLWGGIGAGKTTLIRALQGGRSVIKTQMIEHAGSAIDTPGEYAEQGNLRRHLLSTSADAHLMIVVQDATRDHSNIPPHYFLMFRQPIIGVVTKIDAAAACPERALGILRQIGVTGDIYRVSALTGAGIPELSAALEERRTQWQTSAVVRRSD